MVNGSSGYGKKSKVKFSWCLLRILTTTTSGMVLVIVYCRQQLSWLWFVFTLLKIFSALKQGSSEPFPYLPVGGLLCEWPANSHLPRFVGFHCRHPLPSSQAGQPRKGPPNKHIAAIKGCFGNTSLTFARHPHYSGCKIILDWDGCFCPGLIFASWPVVKFGFAQVLSRYASLGDGTHEACPSSYLGWLWWDAWRASCRHKMLS